MSITFKTQFRITAPQVDFIDIPVDDDDLLAFICPFLIVNNQDDPRFRQIYLQMKSFLTKLNRSYILPNDEPNGLRFLSHLHEPNEYHLGYSESNKGKAISKERAQTIFDSLRRNRFAQHGSSTTNEAHNVLLLVEGIGQDIMSDTIANVCRNIFAQFTEQQCFLHNVPTVPKQIEFYDPQVGNWSTQVFNLPEYMGKTIILLPKKIIAGERMYFNLYNWFISSNYISVDLMKNPNANSKSKTIKLMKDGTKRAIIKEIYKVYRKPKNSLIDFVIKYPGSLDQFRDYAKSNYPALNLDGLE